MLVSTDREGSQTGSRTVRPLHIAESSVKRRARGGDANYFEAAKSRYMRAVSHGYTPEGKRIRRKVSLKTKQRDTERNMPSSLNEVTEAESA